MSAPRRSRSPGRVPRLAAVVAVAAAIGLFFAGSRTATASIVPTVLLATAGDYSVLGATTVTNTNPSVIGQSVGLSPGAAIVGFPPGIVLPPATIQAANADALQAQSDLTNAYDDAASRDVEFSHPNPDLVGLTLLPGVHAAEALAPLELSGELVLNGQNNADAVFIFRTDSTLITSTGSTITLINGASACNVFWQVGSSATLGSGSFFVGTIMALTSVTVESSTVVHGRTLARTGAVTLDNNVFTQPSCASSATTTTTTTPADTTTTTTTTTTVIDTSTTTTTTTATSATPPTTSAAAAVPTTVPGPVVTIPGSPITTTPGTPVATSPTTGGELVTTTYPFDVTDITLPRTGGTVTAQSGVALAALLIGFAAVFIARGRHAG